MGLCFSPTTKKGWLSLKLTVVLKLEKMAQLRKLPILVDLHCQPDLNRVKKSKLILLNDPMRILNTKFCANLAAGHTCMNESDKDGGKKDHIYTYECAKNQPQYHSNTLIFGTISYGFRGINFLGFQSNDYCDMEGWLMDRWWILKFRLALGRIDRVFIELGPTKSCLNRVIQVQSKEF